MRVVRGETNENCHGCCRVAVGGRATKSSEIYAAYVSPMTGVILKVSERDEELRFAKKQQWYVPTAAVTLIAAIFALADKIYPTPSEKIIAVVVLAAIAIFSCHILRSLQKHIVDNRPKKDEDRERRGAEITWALMVVVALSAIAVGYAIVWRLH